MNERARIRLGILGLVLVVSCGTRTLGGDAGPPGMVGVQGAAGRAGAGGPGGNGLGGGFDPGTAGSSPGVGGIIGTGGVVGAGGRGGFDIGGANGRGGFMGAAGIAGFGGRGGIGGTIMTGRGGFGGTMDLSGRGGIGGTGGLGGRGGTVGRGGTIGTAGMGGIGGVGGRGGFGGVDGMGGTTGRTTLLEVQANDLVYSARRNELYASVPGSAPAYPNSILVVEPITGTITSAIPIGSDPDALALSDDGSTLWVAIGGAHALRKVTMDPLPATPVVGPLVHLPKARPDAYFDTQAMAALAGEPLSVILSMTDGNYTNEVMVLDDGVPRGTGVTNASSSPFYRPRLIAGPPGTVFGLDGSTLYFYAYTVTPAGITTTTTFLGLARNEANDSLAYVGSRLFSGGGGDAIDVSIPTAPAVVGRLSYAGQVARRDAMSVMALAVVPLSFPSIQRTDVRISSANALSEFATVAAPNDIGAMYSHLTYAGGDAVAYLKSGGSSTAYPQQALVIIHNPAIGTPIGGRGGGGGAGGDGGIGGAGGSGGAGGMGGTGGAADPCPGCTFTLVDAYGRDMAYDADRKLIYVAADAMAPSHPSSIVTVDAASATVASFVPVGNDPQSLALSDDGSALWVGLAGERRVRRMTPGATPVPGPAYSLPAMLTTGDASVPMSIAVLPGTPSSIAVGVYGATSYGRAVFILDDGQPRANFIQPPEVTANFLTNGPPGYLLGLGDTNNLVVFHLGAAGATMESYGGLFGNYYTSTGFYYSAGAAYASTGEVIDLSDPGAPVPAGRFAAGGADCKLASRTATRVMMLCPGYGTGGTLTMLDTTTFNRVGELVTSPVAYGDAWVKFLYLGGDAVAMLGGTTSLQIMHAPLIGSPP
ncbi:MAG TPA: hypothetical protein VIF57_28965 [Polyangia bacterium]